MNDPMAEAYSERYCNTRLKIRRFYVKELRHSANVSAKKCYLYRSVPRVRSERGGCASTPVPHSTAPYNNAYRRLVTTTRRLEELLKGVPDIPLLTMRWN